MRTRSYSMDTTEGGSDSRADTGSSDANDNGDTSNVSEFVFDGFKLMFAEKVMLTPVVTTVAPAALTQAQSHRWH